MNRIVAIVASLWVVLAFTMAGVGTVAGAPTDSAQDGELAIAQLDNSTVTNETNESVMLGPGARLAGVVGVQQAEIRGEVEHRTFGLSIAAARSNGSKARVVAQNTERIQDRLRALENRSRQLNESYRNGSMPEAAYYARMAQINTRIRTLERQTNQTIEEAGALPPQSLNQHGVNVTELERVRNQARNMTGPEVAGVARKIGGPHAGKPVGHERGPPEAVPGNGSPGSDPGQSGSAGPGDSQNGSKNGQGPPGQQNNSTSSSNPGGPPSSAGNGSNPGDSSKPAKSSNPDNSSNPGK